MRKGLLGISTVFICLVACTDNAVVRQSVELDPNGWESEEKAEFEFDITDTTASMDMFVDLRHTGDYPYRNLFLFSELTMPNGGTRRDTIECLLADRLGHWLGGGNGFIFSNEVEHDILFSYDRRFPVKGKYSLSFEQAMRDEQLVGVVDIGLIIRPTVK